MKKALFLAITVLVLVYAVFAYLGKGGEYKAESLYYKASTLFGDIARNPDVLPPLKVKKVESLLSTVIAKFPNTPMAKKAYISLGELYIADKDYEKAIKVSDEVLAKFKDNLALTALAHSMKATAYEKKGAWKNAETELNILKDNYKNTSIGMQSPMYIAAYYRKNGNLAEAEKALHEAVNYYERIRNSYAGTALGYVASTALLQTYMGFERYEDAGRVLDGTLKEYPSQMVIMQLLPYAEMIYVKGLGQPDKAKEIFNQYKDKITDEKTRAFLEAKIKGYDSKKPL